MKRKGLSAVTALSIALGLLVAGCGTTATTTSANGPGNSAGTQSTSITPGGTMTWVYPMDSLVDNFNPWSPSNSLIMGLLSEIYEPMFYFNTLTEKMTPKLGTDYTYSADHKTLTINLRQGVKWSDGQSFTSKDVAFTLNMILSHPAVDQNGLKGFIQSVSAPTPSQVVINLKKPNNLALYYIGGQTPIVPEHIWSTVGDPAQYADTSPVTTGPFVLGSYSSSMIVLKKNPTYWDTGKPYINEIDFPLVKTTYGLEQMVNGKFDAANDFLPDAQKVLLRFNNNFHQWLPPIADSYLFTNDSQYPLNLAPFRQALSYAIDRKKIGNVGEYGYEGAANSVGLPDFGGMASHIDRSVVQNYPTTTYNPAKAKSILKQAGFTWDSAGNLIDPHGKPVSLTIIAPGGWPDYDTDISLVAQQWKAIGINAVAKTPAWSTLTSQLANGSYQVAMYFSPSGPDPIITYNALLNSQLIGSSNYERWNDQQTDGLLTQYLNSFDSAQQQTIMNQLESTMAQQLPVIPMLDAVGWEQYNTQRLVGWPDASNPYAAFSTPIDDMYIWTQVHKP